MLFKPSPHFRLFLKQVQYAVVNYFACSEREAKGFIALLFVMAFIFLWRVAIYPHFEAKEALARQASQQAILDSLSAQKAFEDSVSLALRRQYYHAFNPNTVDSSTLASFGFPPKVCARIINYRNKGGQFRKKADLAKMYGLERELYCEIEDYINIPKKRRFKPRKYYQYANSYQRKYDDTIYFKKPYRKKYEKKRYHVNRFEINSASIEDLSQIKGIGKGYAKRIIRYKERLGGYHTLDQLAEVNGLPIPLIDSVKKYADINTDNLDRLHINTASFKSLLKHPYLDYNQVKVIMNYKEQHGEYKTSSDLLPIKIISAAEVRQLAPYLRFDMPLADADSSTLIHQQ